MMKPLFLFLTTACISISTIAQLPSGYIAEYKLDNSATDISGNNYNGSLTSTASTTNRFGTAGTATQFTAGSSTGTLPGGLVLAMQNDFSFCYWFKTNMIANSSAQWYGGNAMVDAEVCGVTSDWGTALINTGKVCFGIGAPDITIFSTNNYNDNNWHFVTAVRQRSPGSITLYVDGAQVATSAGTYAGPLTAPGFIGLARNPCVASGVFTGSLDDIIVYNRTLSPTEVTNLYNFLGAFVLPLQWHSFSGAITSAGIQLDWETENSANNDHFEIEHSVNGEVFSSLASIPDNAGTLNAAGRLSYRFLQQDYGKGLHYYRIKQVDRDGKFSYSKTIKLTIRDISHGLSLLSNPVHDEIVLINRDRLFIRQLSIIDLSGKKIRTSTLSTVAGTIKYPVGDLPQGHYIIQAITAEGEVRPGLFIKM